MSISFRNPFSHSQSSPAGGPRASERTAGPEPGRTSSTDKSDKPKSRFDIHLNPSKLASEFTKLFGKKTEAEKQLKQTAKEILNHVEEHLSWVMNLDEKTKKKLNSSLRKTMTAEEMNVLADTLNAAEKLNGKEARRIAFDLSLMTKNFASGYISKTDFMRELKNGSQKLNNLTNAKVSSEIREKMGAVLTQLESLKKSNTNWPTIETAIQKYESILTLASPADRKAKLEEFAVYLECVNADLKQRPHANWYDFVASFDPSPSRESQHQSPPRSGPPPRRTQSGPSSQRPEAGPPPRRTQSGPSPQRPQSGPPPRQSQSAPRPEPQTMPKPASTTNAKPAYWTRPVAYTGPKLSMGGVRPAEARAHAKILKQHFSADQLKELHSDLLALSNTATDDMKNAFNEKYKNVFTNKYDEKPAAFSVLGKAGLNGCEGDAKQSSFWSVASTHTPRS